MKTKSNPHLDPMKPWPGLSDLQRTVKLSDLGLDIFYYDSGGDHSKTTLLVHGLGDEADTWRYLIEPLSKNSRVIAPDLPGFGRSSKPPTTYSISYFMGVLCDLLQTLKIDQARWIGHSLGALIAQSIALEKPELISSLVLVSGSLLVREQPLTIETLMFLVPGLGEWLYNRLRMDPQKAYDTLYPYYADLDALPAEEREFLYERVNQRVWSDTQRRAYFSTLRNVARHALQARGGLEERLAGCEISTLVIWGEEDKVNPSANAYALQNVLPNVRLVIIPGGGHNLQQEHPQLLLQAVLTDEK